MTYICCVPPRSFSLFCDGATMSLSMREVSQSLWFLVGQVDEQGPMRCIPLHSKSFLIGRRHDLSLCIPRKTVSTVHAEIRQQDGGLYLNDLKSTNGTYLNGRRIVTETLLAEESLVQFADMAFKCGAYQ